MSDCTKRWFASRPDAKKEAKRQLARNNIKLMVYKCDYCDGFHLSTKRSMDYTMRCRGNA